MAGRDIDGNWYSRKFTSPDAADRYLRKLGNPLERIRHGHEVELLSRFVAGSVFDCSIATGRLIGELPKVRSFTGMDYSEEFLSYLRRRHPEVTTIHGDLRKGVPQPDDRYDVALCLRTLSALGHVERIIAEMARITRPGGLVVFDYGASLRKFTTTAGNTVLDAENPEAAIRAAGLTATRRMPLDGVIVRVKRLPALFRLLSRLAATKGVYRTLCRIERLSVSLRNDRYLYIARVPE